MTTATTTRLSPAAGTGPSRITVSGPGGQVDLAVPATTTMAQLLPVLLEHVTTEAERNRPWVLQRLGGDPLDADGTPETLGLRDGEILHLRPGSQALPAMEIDDVAVGVAESVDTTPGRAGPEVTRRLLLAVAGLALATFAAACGLARPGWLAAPGYGAGALVLIGGSVLATRVLRDVLAGVCTGLGACACAALAGLAAGHGAAAIIAPGRRDVLLAGLLAALAALIILTAGGVPQAPFGAVLVAGLLAVAGSSLALAAHWEAYRAAAVLAVAVFITTTRAVRLVLRVARLNIPLLPRTAAELQEGIDPEPAAEVEQRTRLAVGYLDSFTAAAAATLATAAILLIRSPQWATWLLAGLLGTAAVLRARDTTGTWQRTPLVLAGTVAGGFLLAAAAFHLRMPASAVLLAATLIAAWLLGVAASRLPGRRQAPVWGHLADRIEGLTAFALVPVLLQVLHVYAYFRSLVG